MQVFAIPMGCAVTASAWARAKVQTQSMFCEAAGCPFLRDSRWLPLGLSTVEATGVLTQGGQDAGQHLPL